MTNYYTIDSKSVIAILTEQGLKRWWVAEQAGVHKTTLRRWLNGKIAKVQQKNVSRLAQVLTTSENYIARPVPYPFPVRRNIRSAGGGASRYLSRSGFEISSSLRERRTSSTPLLD